MELMKFMYISRSTIPSSNEFASVNNIVATATDRNPKLGVTGALLFTGQHFAQLLEGDRESIDTLIADICRDIRHKQIHIIHHGPLAERRFANWSLAYFGPSQFVSRHVTRLLNDPSPSDQLRAAEWLDELLWEFSARPGAKLG